MEIDKNSLENFTELEIIAHCLHEMTYAGFEQDEIQAQMDNIKQIKVDYEKLSPEEKAKSPRWRGFVIRALTISPAGAVLPHSRRFTSQSEKIFGFCYQTC